MSAASNRHRCAVLGVVLCVAGAADVAWAQSRSGCREAERPSVGFAVGRSAPYVELARGVVDAEAGQSVLVYGGPQFGVRMDLTPAGPLRLRVEGAWARWDVRRKTYDPSDGYREIENTSVGHLSARQLVGLVGLRGGRGPLCWNLLGGGGVYRLEIRDAVLTRPGGSLVAGIEFPTGALGVVQADIQLQMIDTNGLHPVSMSTVLAASVTVGWSIRLGD
jgi:hypothetical protein